jgi:dipeptidyl aminopeptidase/acylaminoacyl peptidase
MKCHKQFVPTAILNKVGMQVLIVAITLLISAYESAYGQISYMLPPAEIVELVDAPATPGFLISPDRTHAAILHYRGLMTISEMAEPELRLAGIRFNPATYGPSRARYANHIDITTLMADWTKRVDNLPSDARLSNFSWSPDGKMLAFTHTNAEGIGLWVADVATLKARQLTKPIVNAVMGTTFRWLPDSRRIIVSAIATEKGAAPIRPTVPLGPLVQENRGHQTAVRTFQDLLRDATDEALFEHYASSQLIVVGLDGTKTLLAKPGIITTFDPSPDGNYLLVISIVKPFSYIVPFQRFAQRVEIVDLKDGTLRLIAAIAPAEKLPLTMGAVRTGPRNFGWRADASATLFWVEALDGGDPKNQVSERDQLYFLAAPFTSTAQSGPKTSLRFAGIIWGNGKLALLSESWPRTRQSKLSRFAPDMPDKLPELLWERSSEDRYSDPGRFQTTPGAFRQQVLQTDRSGNKLFLIGQGASPEGERPFVDEFNLQTNRIKRLWQSQAPWYENPILLLDPNKLILITRRESNETQPNYFARDLRRNRLSQITWFADPMPRLKSLQKQLIHYQRADGIPLSGTLYLPDDFRPGIDKPLPTLLWAYPQEFKNSDAAGQVSGSPYAYTRVGPTSAVMLATQGYAVLDNASFPIVGEGDQEPNDSFVEQLIANAEAAISKLVEMGVADKERIAVSGHSYGAFMTANLLTHSNLFAAGIARSGAYNRTLTPFGFQSEDRTLWEAPDVYWKMSPFAFADKMKTPLLLIHGADDNNSGTFPIQSERYYDALRGQGATVRLVMLPLESHGYSARESVLHMHWEWIQWLNQYVKQK